MPRYSDDEKEDSSTDTVVTPAEQSSSETTGCSSYPKAVWFILFNELCERFSYYGMKAVLILFLSDFLALEKGTALVAYHLFVAGCYFSPLFGGWVSDAHWGRYKTILILSVVYIAGLIILTVSGIPSIYPESGRTVAGAVIGLSLIALGTGGIKPCVSAFGGDQITGSASQLTAFFTIFYISINTGSLMSIIITPQLQQNLPKDIAYVVSFGLPACLLTLSVIVLFLGRNLYRMTAPSGSVISKVLSVIFSAIKARFAGGFKCDKGEAHWLDLAAPAHPRLVVEEVKSFLRVVKVLIPLPVFWALFDQQGSRWVFQAQEMNLVMGGFTIPAASIQAVNPILILILAPFFEKVLYPLVNKCVAVTMLKRIFVGMIVASVSFVICAMVQLAIDNGEPNSLSVWWQLPQYVVMTAAEVMCSITGLEFAYAEAPPSMKSVVMSFFLITVAIGNLIVTASGEVDICGVFCDYLVFAGLMIVAAAWFGYFAYRYSKDKESGETYGELQEMGQTNLIETSPTSSPHAAREEEEQKAY